MAARMNPRLATLCAVAVGAVYATGYYVTQPTAHQLNPGVETTSRAPSSAPAAKAGSSSSTNTNQSTAKGSSSANGQTSSKGSTPSAKSSSSAQTKYKDGTYQATGTNAYGTVGVALSIKQGKITSVRITQCTTHYPESVINPILPNEVKADQTWRIQIVSGATASTYDFAEAVYKALKQAKK
ncbi:FMN-binding protein [Alicyclobacillus sp. SO9]|uniref:FMN-binding protein n=1 Tax=Alicyclobacillus sp. SO9 TaxID=2665646 RepID=UPI0018E908E7|nr:FMN-binding protein [Alicyclobacillus sp. SO9]QQE81037.1 FMN-binding protein [Alicyclobacillus sp. SO9]